MIRFCIISCKGICMLLRILISLLDSLIEGVGLLADS